MPDNATYYHAAYLVTAVILGGYIASIIARQRAVRARLNAERRDAAR